MSLALAITSPHQHLISWSPANRAMPGFLIRSALFSVRKTRKQVTKEVIACLNGVTIEFSGEQLDQSDFDVWIGILHLARGSDLSRPVVFSARSFLKLLGRSQGSSQQQWLNRSIVRLYSATLFILGPKLEFKSKIGGNWVGKRFLSPASGSEINLGYAYSLMIEPDVRNWFAVGYTQLNWESRSILKKKPLAQWLHAFLAATPHQGSYLIAELQRLSGCNSYSSDFRKQLRNALTFMADNDIIIDWEMLAKADNVAISRQGKVEVGIDYDKPILTSVKKIVSEETIASKPEPTRVIEEPRHRKPRYIDPVHLRAVEAQRILDDARIVAGETMVIGFTRDDDDFGAD